MTRHEWRVSVFKKLGNDRLIEDGSTLVIEERTLAEWKLTFVEPEEGHQELNLTAVHRGPQDGTFLKTRLPGVADYRVHGSFRKFPDDSDFVFGRIGHGTDRADGTIVDDNVDVFFGVRTAGGPSGPPDER